MLRRLSLILAPILFALALASCGAVTRGGGPGVPTPVCLPENLQIPVLYSPADGTNVAISGLTFHWVYNPAGCVPSTFEIQVSQSASFYNYSGTTLGADQSDWSPEVGLLSATVYYWRMRAAVPDGQGPWSPIWSFYTGPICDAGSLVAPEPIFPLGYMFVYDAPFLQWTYPSDACLPAGYHLQVSGSEDFSTLDLDLNMAGSSTLATPAIDLDNCAEYFWRVAASDGATDGPFSPTQSFSLNVAGGCAQACSPDQLEAPVPTNPPPGAIVDALQPLLQWGYPYPCLPDGFTIHLSVDREFPDTSLFGSSGPPTMMGGNWSPPVPLEPATKYFWEVAARVGLTQGPFSQWRTFFTGPECESVGDVIAPTLLSPEDGAILDVWALYLSYTAGEGGCIPHGYNLYLGTDPDFDGEEPYQHLDYPGTAIAVVLEDCTTYYWQVAPILDGFEQERSEVWSFTIRAEGPCLAQLHEGIALQEAPCHHGPHPDWQIVGYILTGERALVYGRDMAGHWLAIDNPDNVGERCWVPREVIELPGGDSGLRILNPPESCSRDLSQEACQGAGGTWASGPAAGAPSYYCQCP